MRRADRAPARIARPRGRETLVGGEIDDGNAALLRFRDAAVGRAGIDIEGRIVRPDAFEAAHEALAFVAADRDHGAARRRFHGAAPSNEAAPGTGVIRGDEPPCRRPLCRAMRGREPPDSGPCDPGRGKLNAPCSPRCSCRTDRPARLRRAEDHHGEADRLARIHLRLGRPTQEGGRVLRHLVDRRLGLARAVGHLPLARQRRRHGEIEIGEIGIVVQPLRRLDVRELLEQLGGLLTESRSAAHGYNPGRHDGPWPSATDRAEWHYCWPRAPPRHWDRPAGSDRPGRPDAWSARRSWDRRREPGASSRSP